MRPFARLPITRERPLRTIPFVVAGVALSITLASCGAPPSTSAAPTATAAPSTAAPTTTAPATTSAPTTAPAATTTAAPFIPPGCTPADPGDVERITAGLKRGSALGETFVAAVGARKWINGNVYDGNRRLSSADVWIAEANGTVYALSGGARDLTTFADGRKLPDRPSAGDDVATALQKQCVEPALQARNKQT
jgi:hypothetical protein